MSTTDESGASNMPPESLPPIPPSPESEASTPIANKTKPGHGHGGRHGPSDSMVSISLSESDAKSPISMTESEVSSSEVVQEVLKRASFALPIESLCTVEDVVVDAPRAEEILAREVRQEKARSRSGSLAIIPEGRSLAERRNSTSSDGSVQVDWEMLEQTEQDQQETLEEADSDEQTTLLLARLEQENNAIATDPKSGTKTRGLGQSRPPSVHHLQKLVEAKGVQSVRLSLLPAASQMTELDFWAALVRDYPQTAQRLPTITSNKIRTGIPTPLRGVVWLSMAGARDRAVEEKYDKLCAETSPYEKMIGKDVGRSFPQHEMFRDPDGEGQKMLGRVLKAYSLYDDRIGYCQGLGFLVGPLLMNMGDREAFCILVRLMEDYDLRSCFLPDLSGLHMRIYQFNELLRQHVPKVAGHLESLGFEGEYLSQWFLSFFAVTCPLPLLFRIYDVIFAEGASETIMRVALAIMQRNEKKILGYSEFEDVMQLLISRQLWDVYGLKPECADEFVHSFVSFTPLVTRESLDVLEARYREYIQRKTGGRPSLLPSVSSAASRFLGRLWSTAAKQQQTLAPTVATQGVSRPTSTLLRTPSKQSLSTLSSMEGAITEGGTSSTASTLLTDMSASRESSIVDNSSLHNTKSQDFAAPRRIQTQFNKEKELDSQIEDLLKILSEMQKNQSILNSQLQKMNEDRVEDAIAVGAFVEQVKLDIAAVALPKLRTDSSHRRTASEAAGRSIHQPFVPPKLSATSVRLLESLESRLSSRHMRRSSGVETKADLRSNIATLREQLHVETTRSQELAREVEDKEQETTSLQDELQKARSRIKDSHFDRQRLEKTILDLKQNQRSAAPSRTNSRADDYSDTDPRDSADSSNVSKAGGLRELRLGRGISRTNSSAPTHVASSFPKRLSSLAMPFGSSSSANDSSAATEMAPPSSSPTRPRHAATASVPVASSAHHTGDTDALLLELAGAKTAEAVARQELEEMRARFDALRKIVASTSPPSPAATSPDEATSASAAAVVVSAPHVAVSGNRSSENPALGAASLSSSTSSLLPPAPAAVTSGFGFFGWGSRR